VRYHNAVKLTTKKKYTFDSALRRVLQVSKTDLDRMLEAEKKAKREKPKSKPSGRA
jgi:hypothetical protein